MPITIACLGGQEAKSKRQKTCAQIKPSLFFVILGETPRNFFDRVKKRYLKHRLELKKVNKSGTSSAVVDTARRELNAYTFLFWLDAYLKPRRTTWNIPDNISDVSTGCDDEESCDESFQKDEVAWQESDEVKPVCQIYNKKRKPETKAKKAKKIKKIKKRSPRPYH